MALITTYATLQSEVALWLHRTDLTENIKVFIQMAERRFRRDPRVKQVDGTPEGVVPLSDAATSNWLLAEHPDIYLYGTLVESAPYLKDDERVPVWKAELEARLTELGSTRIDTTRTLTLATYAGFIRIIKDWLDLPHLAPSVPVFIQLAEARLRKDPRVRKLHHSDVTISADATVLSAAGPTAIKYIESWQHDGGTYYGAIEIVGYDQIAALKTRYGATGVPQFAALLEGAAFSSPVAYFAPAPDGTYSTKMAYWRSITALASEVNWLYTEHPDIYLYATLVEAAPYLGDDPRVGTWEMALQERLEAFHQTGHARAFGGSLRRQIEPFG